MEWLGFVGIPGQQHCILNSKLAQDIRGSILCRYLHISRCGSDQYRRKSIYNLNSEFLLSNIWYLQKVLHLHLLLMFVTMAHRVPIICFNTLSVQEREKLSAYVSYISERRLVSWIANVLFQIESIILVRRSDAELLARGCINDANNMQKFL